jgi:hypothetical protein
MAPQKSQRGTVAPYMIGGAFWISFNSSATCFTSSGFGSIEFLQKRLRFLPCNHIIVDPRRALFLVAHGCLQNAAESGVAFSLVILVSHKIVAIVPAILPAAVGPAILKADFWRIDPDKSEHARIIRIVRKLLRAVVWLAIFLCSAAGPVFDGLVGFSVNEFPDFDPRADESARTLVVELRAGVATGWSAVVFRCGNEKDLRLVQNRNGPYIGLRFGAADGVYLVEMLCPVFEEAIHFAPFILIFNLMDFIFPAVTAFFVASIAGFIRLDMSPGLFATLRLPLVFQGVKNLLSLFL